MADIFSSYYASIAEYESESDSMDNLAFSEMTETHQTHGSIVLIRRKISFAHKFHLNITSSETFAKYIDKLQNNKAVGYDDLKATFNKISGSQLCNSLFELFNRNIKVLSFPSDMKVADNFYNEYYRSINLLAMVSKLFENIVSDQITD